MEVTDLVLLDIKEINPEQHELWLDTVIKPFWNVLVIYPTLENLFGFRHVLVPNLTDRDEEIWLELGKFVKTLNNVEHFEVLPYHNLGEFKWRELGRPYPLEGPKPPTRARVENAKTLIEELNETSQEYLNRIKG